MEIIENDGPLYITRQGWRWEVYCRDCRTGVQCDSKIEAQDHFDHHDHSGRDGWMRIHPL